jgi:hypothetical protein
MKLTKEKLIALIKEELENNSNEEQIEANIDTFENMLLIQMEDCLEQMKFHRQKYNKLQKIKSILDGGDPWSAAVEYDAEIGYDNSAEKEATKSIIKILGENKENISEGHKSELEKPFLKYMTKTLGWSMEDTKHGYALTSPDGKHREQMHWGSDAGIRTAMERLSKTYNVSKHDFRRAFESGNKLDLPTIDVNNPNPVSIRTSPEFQNYKKSKK